MSRARDDRRRNNRREFALYHRDEHRSEVGSYSHGQADGCWEYFRENGDTIECGFSETHEPGSHFELGPSHPGHSAWGMAVQS